MDYISAKEAANLWGISQRRVAALCSNDRIPGSEMIGNMWLIPKTAEKPDDGRSSRYENETKLKPFLKWAGGKGQLLEEIRKKYPDSLGNSIKKYAEPFVGGGAVLFDILSNYEMDEVYISDSNRELICTYQNIRDNIDELIEILQEYEEKYIPLAEDERKTIYYENRKKFNELKTNHRECTELAALFIFLNRTCFNGLYRVNAKGEYNVPMGSYKKPCICDERNLRNISSAMKNITIVCGDYHNSDDFIDDNTFVYFDPPYRPLSESSSFTAYTENDFNDRDQEYLAQYISELSDKGAYVVASNSDPKNTNPDDDFFDNLYKDFAIERIYATRMINSKASERGKITELLIYNKAGV